MRINKTNNLLEINITGGKYMIDCGGGGNGHKLMHKY